jgi:beta-lactamase regulating signal transducer with metallopeptidase domain
MTVISALLETSIFSGIILAAILLFKTLFKKHLSPFLQYALWFLLIARLLVPVTPDPGFHFITLPAAQVGQMQPESSVSSGTAPAEIQAASAEGPTLFPETASAVQDSNPLASAEGPASSGRFPAISPAALLLLAWVCGMAFFLLRLLSEYALLKGNLSHASAPPSSRICLLAQKVKKDLGLHANIRVVLADGLNSPALSAKFRPTIMLPAHFLLQGDAQIEFALRHELMHFKQKDHLITLLLAVLRAVYWFNPVIWIAFKKIKSDMESACDSMAARNMDAAQKKDYAATILNMYADPPSLVLSMGLSENRREAERRIRAIFNRPHAGKKTKALSVLVASVLAVSCFTTACRPVFDQAAAYEQAQSFASISPASPASSPTPSPQPTPYEVPVPWEQVETFGNLTIDIGTLVIMPDDPYPVLRIQIAAFTQDQLKNMTDYFAQSVNASSADTAAVNQAVESALNEPVTQTIGLKDNTVDATVSWRIAGQGSLYSRFTFGTGRGYIEDGKNLYVTKDNVEVWNTASGISQADWGKHMSELDFSYIEQAQAKADQVISDLGIQDLKLWGNNIGVLLPYEEEYNAFDGRQPAIPGFIFEYVRSANDLYGYHLGGRPSPGLKSEYMPAYPVESLSIFVSGEGEVEFFNWNCPLDVLTTEKENAALLPFEQIKDILFENIRANSLSTVNNETVNITVYSAQLMMVLVQSEDDLLQAFMTPAWVFNTNGTYTYEEDGNHSVTYADTYIIDAITGLPVNMPGNAGSAQAVTEAAPSPVPTAQPAAEYMPEEGSPAVPESAVEYVRE